jgi:preprotein translocase subunit YajC
MKKGLCILFLMGFSQIALADAGVGAGPSMMSNIVMVAGFLLIFYFMLIRPQTKRAKEHQALITNIAKDDEVITNGGILGKVLRVTDQFIVIAISEGIEVKVQKQAISATLPKGTIKSI